MPLGRAVCLALTAASRNRLKRMVYGHKTEYRARQRATVVLLAAHGRGNARTAAETRLHAGAVRTWRGRFADGGLPAPADRKRSGRPDRFPRVQVAEAKALACQLSAETGLPLSGSPRRPSAAARTAPRIFFQVPAMAHLISRLWAVWNEPNSSGRFRQGELVRYVHAMASRMRR